MSSPSGHWPFEYRFFKDRQSAKQYGPNDFTVEGNVMDSNEMQSRNAETPILETLFRSTSFKDIHPLKASPSISFIPSGILIDVNDEQL